MNTKLFQALSAKGNIDEYLQGIGFVKEDDGSNDPRGVDWNIRNDKFHLMIDPWADVTISRINPDTDSIKVVCEDLYELESIVEFIKD